MTAHLTEGFLLGIATGTTCLATCGPIYAPYLMQYERSFAKSVLTLLEISAGRFLTYLLVGFAAGSLGAGIAGVSLDNRDWFTATAYILFSAFLLFTTFRTHRKEQCCRVGRWSSLVDRPFVLGLLTGINFCPSFLIALTKAVDLSGPVAGMTLFGAFFVGTSLFLLPLSFFGYFGAKKFLRTVARVSAVGVALWFLIQAGITLTHLVNKPRETPIDSHLVINLTDSGTVYFLAADTSAFASIRRAFAARTKSSVMLVGEPARLPDSGIIFIGKESEGDGHLEQHPLRKKGRFVVILPDSSTHASSTDEAGKLLDFLSFYSFKINPDSGSVFQVPLKVIRP